MHTGSVCRKFCIHIIVGNRMTIVGWQTFLSIVQMHMHGKEEDAEDYGFVYYKNSGRVWTERKRGFSALTRNAVLVTGFIMQ